MWQRLAVLVLLVWSVSLAQAAPTTPAADFTDNGDGTVTHKTTGLTWKRCAEGMTWTGTTCSGTAKTYTWAQANALSTGGWRLPRIDELVTIVERDNYDPAINATMFPNTPTSMFWSASLYANNSGKAWYVEFGYGSDDAYFKTNYYYVRLVRGGQSLDSSGLYTLTSDFSDNGDGSVTHKKTSLTWKRCAEGQSWTGSTCSGTAKTYAWSAAKALSTDGWRLPTQNELLTIVEWSKIRPAINTTIFPNTSSIYFWSASAYAGSSEGAWKVDFLYGGGSTIYETYDSVHVRLVRGGQSVGASSTQSNQPPTPWFTATPESGAAPLTVNLDASASSDSDGSIISYIWRTSDGQNKVGQYATLTFDTAGSYLVTLTVSDDKGATQSTSQTIMVTAATSNKPPVAAFTVTPTSGTTPLTISLDASTSSDPDGSIASYAWRTSDGQTATGRTASLTFTQAGSYAVTLIVTDNKGATNSAARTVVATAATSCSSISPTISLNQTIAGTLEKGDCLDASGKVYDRYSVALTQGQVIALSLRSDAFSPWLEFYDTRGDQVSVAQSTTPSTVRIPTGSGAYYSVPVSGTYSVVVSGNRQDQVGGYALTVSNKPALTGFQQMDQWAGAVTGFFEANVLALRNTSALETSLAKIKPNLPPLIYDGFDVNAYLENVLRLYLAADIIDVSHTKRLAVYEAHDRLSPPLKAKLEAAAKPDAVLFNAAIDSMAMVGKPSYKITDGSFFRNVFGSQGDLGAFTLTESFIESGSMMLDTVETAPVLAKVMARFGIYGGVLAFDTVVGAVKNKDAIFSAVGDGVDVVKTPEFTTVRPAILNAVGSTLGLAMREGLTCGVDMDRDAVDKVLAAWQAYTAAFDSVDVSGKGYSASVVKFFDDGRSVGRITAKSLETLSLALKYKDLMETGLGIDPVILSRLQGLAFVLGVQKLHDHLTLVLDTHSQQFNVDDLRISARDLRELAEPFYQGCLRTAKRELDSSAQITAARLPYINQAQGHLANHLTNYAKALETNCQTECSALSANPSSSRPVVFLLEPDAKDVGKNVAIYIGARLTDKYGRTSWAFKNPTTGWDSPVLPEMRLTLVASQEIPVLSATEYAKYKIMARNNNVDLFLAYTTSEGLVWNKLPVFTFRGKN